ncbi:2Fe-2S iron-sulfur cluster-binding protein [Paracidovorax anthurii]|uniref:Ferredoxin-NAD(P)+ reductase (Naphthalene dioxygenase ferredoxin-specific) n=1 Tax=Paracidovorax anthurii TaxID=78229 RepID=A0A328ZNF8_9BURK|nr:2Fe-2S iron-sulfur cluster-binding protein [Paracidovorax anthurii]RAR86573.1 ferredoxin-NAD(P)+ reductase (naphthalene dioxygenase ferredoxin-specific) [Paracidovorax anthurii]
MELRIQPLGRVLSAPAGANLLEVLREHQIPVSYSCMAGRCGTCRCKVLSGDVLDTGRAMRRPSEGDEETVLACQTVLSESCTIEIPEPDEVVVHPARILKAAVVAIETLTHDIRRLRLKPAKPLEFSPGQYAHLQFGPGLVRPYSMAGLAGDGELEFHVRLVAGGQASEHVANALAVGDAVRVSGPLGSAYLRRRHDGPMLCVAGGTGLAPILSIVRGALEGGMRNPIHVYCGARSPRDVYGLPWLEALRRDHGNLHVHAVVAGGHPAPGQRPGLVTEAIAQDWRDLRGWRAYLCGSPPMVEAASLLARQRGIDPAHIHADAFYASVAA